MKSYNVIYLVGKLKIFLLVSASLLLLSIIPQNATAFHLNFNLSRFTSRLKFSSPSPIPSPGVSPSPSPKHSPTPSLSPTPQTASTVSYEQKKTYIMNAINNYRSSLGLSQVSNNSETCNFAKTRAGEITLNFNHDGFRNRINSKTLPYLSYHMVSENIAMNSNYKNVVSSWINSSGHAANMRQDTPYVCVEGSGNYWAYEGWKP